MDDMKKIILEKVNKMQEMNAEKKKELILVIVSKIANFLLGILFWKLRGKAKLEGKKCKACVFLVLSIMCFAGIFTGNGNLKESDDEVFDSDFEEEFVE